MLSEILFASTKREARPDRIPGITCSALFPCPYRLYKVHIGEPWEEEWDARQILNAQDGWFQEEQSIQLLKEAGIRIGDRQAHVDVGGSHIPGHIDGTVTLGGKKRLWEHKAWSESSFDWFVSRGIDYYPGQKAQVNAYMLGMELDECILFLKRKDNNDYFDAIIPLERGFILPIIEWADKIRLEGWVPEPKLCKYCAHCSTRCFGHIVDFSWIKEAKAPEMAEKWRQGDKLTKVGEMMKDEARLYFVGSIKEGVEGLIGTQDVLLVEGLKIMKVIQHRLDISRAAIIREFGPEALIRVGVERDVVTYRIGEV